jgi:hypothetical protein
MKLLKTDFEFSKAPKTRARTHKSGLVSATQIVCFAPKPTELVCRHEMSKCVMSTEIPRHARHFCFIPIIYDSERS